MEATVLAVVGRNIKSATGNDMALIKKENLARIFRRGELREEEV